ncbi:phosphotransferase [Kribbella sp. NPDC006257]|uniref:phosphotransferase n=1 Tax=Kribbella sp. NPDC006257 TaxID=3156738 RepID=UPI0033B3CF8A
MSVEAVASKIVRLYYGARASEPTWLASGAWSHAFALTVDDAALILRIGKHGSDFAKDAAVARLAGPNLRVPAVLAVGEADDWHYAVSPRAQGTALDDLSGHDVALVLPSLLTALDGIADLSLGETVGYGNWAPDGRAPYLAAIAALAQYLPDERRMIHGDLLSRNVLVAESSVTAVLDWGNAMYGDSLYDAAWLIYWWPWYPQWSAVDITSELFAHWTARGTLPTDARERLHAYRVHIGLDAIAYCAFRDRWDEVRANVDTVLNLTKRWQ